jgi:cyclin-dependent kinase 12/13
MRATTTNPALSPSPREQEVEWGSRTVDVYEKIEQIGEGTYGQVYKARNKLTGEIVALKRIRMENEKEGFPITAIREIKILKELNHKNIIKLKEIVVSKSADASEHKKGSIYMVFEYMDHDLAGLLDSPYLKQNGLRLEHIKCYTKQLLEGLHYLHHNNVLHRDIKASNLLINNQGVLKLADFGLARLISNKREGNYTNNVITLWYRPPELLLGAHSYGTAVDMWSVGCILAELLYRKPIFPGKTEIDQLDLIFRLCGTPTDETWPEAKKLPWYHDVAPQKVYKPRLREVFKDFPPSALNLIERLLCLDPARRLSAADALDSDFFWTEPLPCKPEDMPAFPSSHEFTTRKRKQRAGGIDGGNELLSGVRYNAPPVSRAAPSQAVGWNNASSLASRAPPPPPVAAAAPPPPLPPPLPPHEYTHSDTERDRINKRLKTGHNVYHSVHTNPLPPPPPSGHLSDALADSRTHRSSSHYSYDAHNNSRSSSSYPTTTSTSSSSTHRHSQHSQGVPQRPPLTSSSSSVSSSARPPLPPLLPRLYPPPPPPPPPHPSSFRTSTVYPTSSSSSSSTAPPASTSNKSLPPPPLPPHAQHQLSLSNSVSRSNVY